ncbi:hypothetical protein [Burkholderia vietnamiensis]|uniref:hypothetical protein n=1 Tax=Burkholderia vietnamiensis TaxID=60552 RepID=UPI0015908B0C|nr:hypothetical protein [Burkholderia vietnamiensis]
MNGGARATIAPETFVDRSYVAVVQREVALDAELRQPRGQAILPHIPKFQAWHLLPPVTVAIENCGHVAYRRSRPGLPTVAGIDRKALLQKALRRNRQIFHEKDDYPQCDCQSTAYE